MTYPKIRPCFTCNNKEALPAIRDADGLWRVQCDRCRYVGEPGNKLQAIRRHNSAAETIANLYRIAQRRAISAARPVKSPVKTYGE